MHLQDNLSMQEEQTAHTQPEVEEQIVVQSEEADIQQQENEQNSSQVDATPHRDVRSRASYSRVPRGGVSRGRGQSHLQNRLVTALEKLVSRKDALSSEARFLLGCEEHLRKLPEVPQLQLKAHVSNLMANFISD